MTAWARDWARAHYRPMPRRPDVVYTPPWDLPAAPSPATSAAEAFQALAADFVPNPNRSWEQACRYRHADLAGLSAQELWRERRRAAFLAAWLPEGDARTWCEERLKATTAEQERRKRARR